MAIRHVQIRLASLSDRETLLSLLIAFHKHFQILKVSKQNLYFVLVTLMDDPLCDFSLAVAANRSSLGYTQICCFQLATNRNDGEVDSNFSLRGLGLYCLA